MLFPASPAGYSSGSFDKKARKGINSRGIIGLPEMLRLGSNRCKLLFSEYFSDPITEFPTKFSTEPVGFSIHEVGAEPPLPGLRNIRFHLTATVVAVVGSTHSS